jgi:hypothetical protein
MQSKTRRADAQGRSRGDAEEFGVGDAGPGEVGVGGEPVALPVEGLVHGAGGAVFVPGAEAGDQLPAVLGELEKPFSPERFAALGEGVDLQPDEELGQDALDGE